VQRLVLAAIVVIGCRPSEVAYPALAADCSPTRIGKVTVQGATLSDIAPLAVLEGAFDDSERTDRIAEVATELFQVRGYPRARIDITRHVACGVELQVAVDRGPRFKISQLAFQTDDGFPEAERVAAIEDALGTVNAVGGAYVEDRMERALAALARRYHESGWIDAAVGKPHASYDERDGSVAVIVPIQAGPRYRIGAVHAHGTDRETRAEVVAAMGLRGGDWFDAARVRSGIDRARKRLDRRIELRIEVAADRRTIDVEARVGDAR
jgi:outer membrane protein assembly factor BamA